MPFEDVELTTPDSVRIKAYLMLQPGEKPESHPTVILFHANAGNVVRLLLSALKHQKLIFSSSRVIDYPLPRSSTRRCAVTCWLSRTEGESAARAFQSARWGN